MSRRTGDAVGDGDAFVVEVALGAGVPVGSTVMTGGGSSAVGFDVGAGFGAVERGGVAAGAGSGAALVSGAVDSVGAGSAGSSGVVNAGTVGGVTDPGV